MTYTETIIAAKIEAVNTLAAALNSRIDADLITDVGGVQGFLAAWMDGVTSLLPAVVAAKPDSRRTWTEGDADPGEVGLRVIDREGDAWLRGESDWEGSEWPWLVKTYGPLVEVK